MKWSRNIFIVLFLLCVSACFPQIFPTPTSTPQPTNTPQPTITPTPQTFTVIFNAFHDYNGNGNQENGEPPFEGILNKTTSGECTTDINGECEILGVPVGNNNVTIQAPTIYRFITTSIDDDFQLLKGLDINVSENTTIFEPLAEGPYRSPFRDIQKITIMQWKDINLKSCFGEFPDRKCADIKDWLGGRNTYDGHDGTDILFDGEIYAMRSGTVFLVRLVSPDKPLDGYEILIRDNNPVDLKGLSYHGFAHVLNCNVKEGEKVTPETLIGSGSSKYNGGKIHIGLYYGVPKGSHPLNYDFHTNPFNHDLFGEHLWVSFYALPKIIERNNEVNKEITESIYSNTFGENHK